MFPVVNTKQRNAKKSFSTRFSRIDWRSVSDDVNSFYADSVRKWIHVGEVGVARDGG